MDIFLLKNRPMKIKVIEAQSNWFVLKRQQLINDGNIRPI